jgi:hypothetical protein
MNDQPRPRNSIRMLAAIGVLFAAATSTVFAVRLLDAPARPQLASTPATAAAPTTTHTEGSSIDHSVVNRQGLEASPEEPGMPIAAYGF